MNFVIMPHHIQGHWISNKWRQCNNRLKSYVYMVVVVLFFQVKQQTNRMCFHSATTSHLSNILNNPVSIFASKGDNFDAKHQLPPRNHMLSYTKPTAHTFESPCGLRIVNMKLLDPRQHSPETQVLLTLHRTSLTCVIDDVTFCRFRVNVFF